MVCFFVISQSIHSFAKKTSFTSFLSTDGGISLDINVEEGIIIFKPFKNYKNSPYYKFYKKILQTIPSRSRDFFYAFKITDNKKANSLNSFDWKKASVRLKKKSLIIKDFALHLNKDLYKENTYMLFVVKYGAYFG